MRRPAAPAPEPTKLPIRRRCLAGPEETVVALDVFCPSQEATIAADRCAECGFLSKFPRHPARSGECIECSPPHLAEKTAARASAHIDMGEAAARAPLGEVVKRQLACVRPETSVETLLRLMLEDGIEALPVVDKAWKLIGLVTRSDVLRARCLDDDATTETETGDDVSGFHEERHAGETVADVMAPAPHTLPEDARLSHAISLMAAEHITHVPVLMRDGSVVGLLSSLDCLEWFARAMGYSV